MSKVTKRTVTWKQVGHIDAFWGYDLRLDDAGLHIEYWTLPAGFGREGSVKRMVFADSGQFWADVKALFEDDS